MIGRVRGEEGQVTAFVVVVTVALLLCAGLVVDGGRVLAARRQAADIAAGAARAGAQEVSVDDLRTSNAQVLDPGQARAAAHAYLQQAGRAGTVEVTGGAVTVRVEITTPMVILGVAGLVDRTVSGTETARSVRGVSEAEA